MLKSSLLARWLAAVAVLAFPVVAFAQSGPDPSQVKGIVTGTSSIVGVVLIIVFILAFLVFAWGVVKYITSAGNPEKEKEARRFLWWGVIGIFVLASVWGLVKFIGTYFGVGQQKGNIIIPGVQGVQ